MTHFKVEPNHSRNAQAWCPPLYSPCSTGSQQGATAGKEGRKASKRHPFYFYVYIFRKKKKWKPLLKIAAMLYMLTLHKNGNQRTFVVYSSNWIVQRKYFWSSEWQGDRESSATNGLTVMSFWGKKKKKGKRTSWKWVAMTEMSFHIKILVNMDI